MELLMILLDRGRMSDYSDVSSGYGLEIFTLIVVVGFILYAIIRRKLGWKGRATNNSIVF